MILDKILLPMFTGIMAVKDPSWLSIGEAAQYLGVSRDTLRRWEKKGKIKPIRSPSNRRYYTKKQLNQIKSGQQVETKKQPETGLKRNLSKRELILLGVFVLVLTLLTVVFTLFLF